MEQNILDSPVPRTDSDADLHDHRFQPQSLPRHGTMHSTTSAAAGRRGSVTNIQIKGPEFRQFDEEVQRVTRRDSDQSDGMMVGNLIIEDSSEEIPISPKPLDMQRRPSVVQGTQKRGRAETTASRRPQLVSPDSPSRSPSPPNSVEAFATTKRKGRSGTFSSNAPSDIASLRRTASRRLSDEDLRLNISGDEAQGEVEEDVCFPMPEEPVRWKIDFDEMEEFVTEQEQDRRRSVGSCERRRKMSTCSSLRGRFFPQIRNICQNNNEVVASPIDMEKKNESAIIDDEDEQTEVADEKNVKDDNPQQQQARRPSPPDRFSFFSSELDSTIHAPYFGDLLIEGESIRELFRNDHHNVWWLDCFNPTEAEMKMLSRAFGLHPLTSEDIRVQETREKVELFRSYYFVCFRSFIQDKTHEDYMEPINIYVVVFREGCVSFQFSPSPHSSNVRRRIRKLRDYMALSSDWICYALIDDITDAFGPAINEVEHDADAIEDAVFTARTSDFANMLKRIGESRKKVMGLMRLLGGKADVIKGFAKRCNEHYEVTPRGDIGLYLGDIQDHVITMMANLSHFEKMLSRSHSNYLAQLSVDHMESNNRTNEVLGKITIIATILVPLNVICGLFGMNVPVPGRESGNLSWFFGIVGVICFIVVFSMVAAKKMRNVHDKRRKIEK